MGVGNAFHKLIIKERFFCMKNFPTQGVSFSMLEGNIPASGVAEETRFQVELFKRGLRAMLTCHQRLQA